jgi:hypothetical protein
MGTVEMEFDRHFDMKNPRSTVRLAGMKTACRVKGKAFV